MVNAGFPRTERILKREEFLRLSRAGNKFETRSFLVLWTPAAVTSRVGITVSRKVGNSVVRNRVKRLVREWYRHHKPVTSLDLSIIARRSAAGLEYHALCRELDRALAAISGDRC